MQVFVHAAYLVNLGSPDPVTRRRSAASLAHSLRRGREIGARGVVVHTGSAVRAGRPSPSGTVLTLIQYKAKTDDKGTPVKGPDGHFVKDGVVAYAVMEKRAGWGAEYPDDLRNGEWEYQAFTADNKVNEKANLKACFQCHKPHEKQDFVMSLASLSGTGLPKSVARKSGPVNCKAAHALAIAHQGLASRTKF